MVEWQQGKITSSSHNARSTCSSKDGSTRLGGNGSRRSDKDGAVSRQGWDVGDLLRESELERGCEEIEFEVTWPFVDSVSSTESRDWKEGRPWNGTPKGWPSDLSPLSKADEEVYPSSVMEEVESEWAEKDISEKDGEVCLSLSRAISGLMVIHYDHRVYPWGSFILIETTSTRSSRSCPKLFIDNLRWTRKEEFHQEEIHDHSPSTKASKTSNHHRSPTEIVIDNHLQVFNQVLMPSDYRFLYACAFSMHGTKNVSGEDIFLLLLGIIAFVLRDTGSKSVCTEWWTQNLGNKFRSLAGMSGCLDSFKSRVEVAVMVMALMAKTAGGTRYVIHCHSENIQHYSALTIHADWHQCTLDSMLSLPWTNSMRWALTQAALWLAIQELVSV